MLKGFVHSLDLIDLFTRRSGAMLRFFQVTASGASNRPFSFSTYEQSPDTELFESWHGFDVGA